MESSLQAQLLLWDLMGASYGPQEGTWAMTSCSWSCYLQAVPAGPALLAANPHLALVQLLERYLPSGVPDPQLDEGNWDV